MENLTWKQVKTKGSEKGYSWVKGKDLVLWGLKISYKKRGGGNVNTQG